MSGTVPNGRGRDESRRTRKTDGQEADRGGTRKWTETHSVLGRSERRSRRPPFIISLGRDRVRRTRRSGLSHAQPSCSRTGFVVPTCRTDSVRRRCDAAKPRPANRCLGPSMRVDATDKTLCRTVDSVEPPLLLRPPLHCKRGYDISPRPLRATADAPA
ncbi:hypothetical protein FKP32DRAFT_1595463 [Trametes sanguinea]|nr:hypothetical protein FKP32DRAFT_1595463 [Trametes sanguinea]